LPAIFQEKFDAKALGMFSVDGIVLVGTKPVKTLDDWKGLLAGAGAPVTASLFKGLGASPVTIMWTDLYESLQKKIIDSTAMTAHGALAMNLMDVCDHITFFYGQGSFNGWCQDHADRRRGKQEIPLRRQVREVGDEGGSETAGRCLSNRKAPPTSFRTHAKSHGHAACQRRFGQFLGREKPLRRLLCPCAGPEEYTLAVCRLRFVQ
jgi:hypothetical protein